MKKDASKKHPPIDYNMVLPSEAAIPISEKHYQENSEQFWLTSMGATLICL